MQNIDPNQLLEQFEQDPLYRGNPWKVIVLERVHRREEFIYSGDTHNVGIWGDIKRAPTTSRGYVKVKEGINDEHNLVIVSKAEAGVMMIPKGHEPDIKRASKSNPASINAYFRWIPNYTHINKEHLSTKPLFLTEERLAEFEEYKKRFTPGWEAGEKVRGTKYICSCGMRHVRTVFFDRDEIPPKVCPRGGTMTIQGEAK